jgi:hypothetical protein
VIDEHSPARKGAQVVADRLRDVDGVGVTVDLLEAALA